MSEAFIALGSNIDDPLKQLAAAYQGFLQHPALTPTGASSVYLSAPHGPQDQPDFCNAVVMVTTSLAPEALLKTLLSTEGQLGRQRSRHWGERRIDLDLIFYDELDFTSASLVLPHPRAHERLFVLDPLIELMGENYVFRGRGPLHKLRAQCAEQTIRVLCQFPK